MPKLSRANAEWLKNLGEGGKKVLFPQWRELVRLAYTFGLPLETAPSTRGAIWEVRIYEPMPTGAALLAVIRSSQLPFKETKMGWNDDHREFLEVLNREVFCTQQNLRRLRKHRLQEPKPALYYDY